MVLLQKRIRGWLFVSPVCQVCYFGEKLKDSDTAADGTSFILKLFGAPPAREVQAYTLLKDLGVPTIRVVAMATDAILLEDLKVSKDLKLARESDIERADVGVALAEWYRKLHDSGSRIHEGSSEKTSFLWREIEELTPTAILDLAEMVGSDRPKWVTLSHNIEQVKQAAMARSETLTYNDFHWTNLALSRSESRFRAVVFDYHLLGLGLRYSDCRNVTGSLSDRTADAFRAAYGETDPVEESLDSLLAPLYALVEAFKRPKFPSWAERSLKLATTG